MKKVEQRKVEEEKVEQRKVEEEKVEQEPSSDFYDSLDDEYREKFSFFTGVGKNDRGFSLFTYEDQLKRYSSALIFWKVELDRLQKMDFSTDPDLFRRFAFVDQKYEETLIMIRSRPVFRRHADNFDEFLEKLERLGMRYYHVFKSFHGEIHG